MIFYHTSILIRKCFIRISLVSARARRVRWHAGVELSRCAGSRLRWLKLVSHRPFHSLQIEIIPFLKVGNDVPAYCNAPVCIWLSNFSGLLMPERASPATRREKTEGAARTLRVQGPQRVQCTADNQSAAGLGGDIEHRDEFRFVGLHRYLSISPENSLPDTGSVRVAPLL